MTMVSENQGDSVRVIVIVFAITSLGQGLANPLTRLGGEFRAVVGYFGPLAQRTQRSVHEVHLPLDTTAIDADPKMHPETHTLPEA